MDIRESEKERLVWGSKKNIHDDIQYTQNPLGYSNVNFQISFCLYLENLEMCSQKFMRSVDFISITEKSAKEKIFEWVKESEWDTIDSHVEFSSCNYQRENFLLKKNINCQQKKLYEKLWFLLEKFYMETYGFFNK